MSAERYHLGVGSRVVTLPRSTKPSTLLPVTPSRNLVRARGYLKVHDLSDGLPDPADIVLTARVMFRTEAELSAFLATLHRDIRSASSVWRGPQGQSQAQSRRPPIFLQGGHLIASPAGAHSGAAELVINLKPDRMPDPAAITSYFF